MIKPKVGDILLTTFGVATVTNVTSCGTRERESKDGNNDNHVEDQNYFFQAYLWRIPHKSIGSCSSAFLRSDTIIKQLPVAPGMKTVLKKESTEIEVMVHCYSIEKNQYLVSSIKSQHESKKSEEKRADHEVIFFGKDGFIWSQASDLDTAKCSKFYPLLVDLMQRGNQAAASASKFFKQNSKLSSLVKDTSNIVSEIATNESIQKMSQDLTNKTKSLAISVPDSTEIKDIYNMLRDEELTVLLESGRKRLQQLISEEIPQTTLTTLKESGIEIEDLSTSSALSSMEQSRKQALNALDKLLTKNLDLDVETLQQSVVEQFTTMFDSFASAAMSDSMLNSIFNTVNGKTLEWQEQSGRLLQTRSISLFFESSQRFQTRVEGLFTAQQLAWAGETHVKLTKALTEGDVAMARLKSIELGDAIRSRLFKAIEIRNDTSGGLDGIIAGAISKVEDNKLGQNALDQAQMMLAELQKSASSKTKDTNESLLAMISQKSSSRDTVLLRIEEVFCHIDSQLEEGMTAHEIACIASGEGGTAALLQPVARRAAAEIEKQLEYAEKSVTDPTILTVLAHVRNIISGDMNVSSLMDEITSVLNDEKIVSVGENLAIEGERLLDVIENANNNKLVNDVIVAVEKAGLTKENIMDQVNNLDINKILDTAETAITDEQKREELLSSATDSALDFLLCVLPSMPVPSFDGVKDGLLYHISNLSLEGFKVKKENIFVDIAGARTSNQKGANLDKNNSKSFENQTKEKSKDVLIIDVQNISAILDKAIWSFEQTYFPYVKGNGEANVKLSDGHIKLKFELRKRPVVDQTNHNDAVASWKPVLCLHERFCEIGEIKLSLEGEGSLTWIFNKLAALFKVPLRDYVVQTILSLISNKSGWLLERLNDILGNYWDLILKASQLTIDDLAEASEEDIIAALPDPYENEVDLVWRDHVPLGMNLLLNDESGYIKVVDFPRGSQARKVTTNAHFDPKSFEGAIIVAVNGTRYTADDGEDLFDALKDPSRPKTIRFKLSNQEDVVSMRDFISKNKLEGLAKDSTICNTQQTTLQTHSTLESVEFVRVEIKDSGPIGIVFSKTLDNFALMVQEIKTDNDVPSFNLEQNIENLSTGLLLSHVNDHMVIGRGADTKKALSSLEIACLERPLSLTFTRSYHNLVCFEESGFGSKTGGPEELVLEVEKSEGGPTNVFIKGFRNVEGMAEIEGAVIGDQLLFINGEPVGAACHAKQSNSPPFEHVMRVLQDPKSYPMALTFGRENQGTNRWSQIPTFDLDQAFTFCVTINSFEDLGCMLAKESELGNIVVRGFYDINGPFQRQMLHELKDQQCLGLAIESINGEVIPSYATSDIVLNVMKRRWTAEKKIDILLCNMERKKMIYELERS